MSQIKPHTFLMRQWPFQVQGGEYSIPATMKKMIAIRITVLIVIICNFPLPSREWKVTAHFKVGIFVCEAYLYILMLSVRSLVTLVQNLTN